MISSAHKKSPGRCRDFLVHQVERSVFCDDGTAKAIAHPHRPYVHVLADIVAARDCNVRWRECDVRVAHEQVVVFNAYGPVRRKAEFNSGSDRATPASIACLIVHDTGCGEKGAVFVIGDRSAALNVPENVVPGVADLACGEADAVDLGSVGRGNQHRQARI
jgi:hypothetical protein